MSSLNNHINMLLLSVLSCAVPNITLNAVNLHCKTQVKTKITSVETVKHFDKALQTKTQKFQLRVLFDC
jgi:hypothetical protein